MKESGGDRQTKEISWNAKKASLVLQKSRQSVSTRIVSKSNRTRPARR